MRPVDSWVRGLAAVVVLLLGLCGVSRADTATWPFDVTTTGEDEHWVSPTAVDNHADVYVLSYQLSQLIVTVKYLIFTFDLDLTDQVPPENQSGSVTAAGPPPLIVTDQWISYPPPPDPLALEAYIVIGLDETGHGYVSATNIYLGTAVVDLGPPWGTVTVQIKAIRVVGTITAEANNYPLGDLNCDGTLDGADIDPFFFALGDPYAYIAAYPNCNITLADVNGDGGVDGADIQGFFDLLAG